MIKYSCCIDIQDLLQFLLEQYEDKDEEIQCQQLKSVHRKDLVTVMMIRYKWTKLSKF